MCLSHSYETTHKQKHLSQDVQCKEINSIHLVGRLLVQTIFTENCIMIHQWQQLYQWANLPKRAPMQPAKSRAHMVLPALVLPLLTQPLLRAGDLTHTLHVLGRGLHCVCASHAICTGICALAAALDYLHYLHCIKPGSRYFCTAPQWFLPCKYCLSVDDRRYPFIVFLIRFPLINCVNQQKMQFFQNRANLMHLRHLFIWGWQ